MSDDTKETLAEIIVISIGIALVLAPFAACIIGTTWAIARIAGIP